MYNFFMKGQELKFQQLSCYFRRPFFTGRSRREMDEARVSRMREELTKARRKRDEWEAKVKDLERRYKEAENTCIHEMVYAASLSPEQLAELIRAASTGMIPGVAALQGEAEYRSDDAGDTETEEEEEREDTEE